MAYVELPEFVDQDHRGDPNPYPSFAWMRETMPVGQVVGPNGEGTVWFVTSYEHARACLADPRLSTDRRTLDAADPRSCLKDEGDLLGSDPPDHTRLRQLVNPILSPGATERLRPKVVEVCSALIDAFADRGTANLVAEFAWPIPVAVVHDYFGIPESERMEAGRCIDRFLRAGYTEQPYGGPATQELQEYVRHVIGYKRKHPGDDVVTVMVDGRDRGVIRSDAELEGMLYVLIGAGQVSTGPLIAGAVLRLLAEPEELARLLAAGEPDWRPVVEEALRYDSPVQTSVSRFAAEDLEIGGTRIPQGDTVVISLAAANRDPARFSGADRFDPLVDRRTNLAFGHGIHLCVGAPLARLEGEVALQVLFRRLPDLRLAAPPESLAWVLGPKLRSPRELPVRFTPA